MTTSPSSTVRTRFAPSPSGHLHVGGARTALFCWACARQRGGRFILRIEDTDQKRTSDAAAVGFLHDLDWLGIEWNEGPPYERSGGGDFGPYFCSERLDIYHQYIEQLIGAGRAYRAFETPDELAAKREAAQRAGRSYRYDRAALALDQPTIQQYLDEGRPHVVRFRLPDDQPEVVFQDAVLGEIRTPIEELDDFVILKADGFPTYHFAVVVDDELMQISHIIRGQEHASNTPRHVVLQDALSFRRPSYAHVSVIFNPDGSKMSKRDKDKALRSAVREQGVKSPPLDPGGEPVVSEEHWQWWQASKDRQLELEAAESLARVLEVPLPEINVDDFRRSGYLPDVLINYLALLGWSPGSDIEKFDRNWFIEHFDFDRLVKSPAKFDRDKLLAFNLDALQAMPPDEFARQVRDWAEQFDPDFVREFDTRYGRDRFELFATINQERSKTLADPTRSCGFFIINDDALAYEENKTTRKALTKGEPNGYERLEQIVPIIQAADEWTVESVTSLLNDFVEARGDGNFGQIGLPLRIATTGGTASPAIIETLAILGRDAVVRRIQHCLASRIDAAPTAAG